MSDWLSLNVDLHMHGLYSMAVSKQMVPSVIAQQSKLKGVDIVASSDILHDGWRKLIRKELDCSDESMPTADNGTKFILQTEIEDANRVHQLILFPSLSKVEEVKERLKGKCKDFESDGRPKVWVNGAELVDIAHDAGCLVGFAHAFTPYFGLYAKFDSYKDCYEDQHKNVHFLELGLSADTTMADQIGELHHLTFTSNSDGHSPWPNKLGREFNTMRVADATFDEIAKALKREAGRAVTQNVGFNPLEGKYHKTRCTGCLTFYEPQQAAELRWRCPECKKTIKKGVDWRISELATEPLNTHPPHRPPYLHTIPLSEIIALAIGVKNAWSQKVQSIWQQYVAQFDTEINALLNASISELEEINKTVAEYVEHFRDGSINYVPGGAGVYGKLLAPGEKPPENSQLILKKFIE